MAAYGDPVCRALLHAYKYEGVAEAGEVLTRLFKSFLHQHKHMLTALTYEACCVGVPLHWLKSAMRGFDQVASFVGVLREVTAVREERITITRKFGFRPQAHLMGLDARKRNVAGVFGVEGHIRGRYVIVDDVVTTGATVRACAEALKAAGASSVSVVTVLRG